jgi:hypothetical protein
MEESEYCCENERLLRGLLAESLRHRELRMLVNHIIGQKLTHIEGSSRKKIYGYSMRGISANFSHRANLISQRTITITVRREPFPHKLGVK